MGSGEGVRSGRVEKGGGKAGLLGIGVRSLRLEVECGGGFGIDMLRESTP